MPCKARLPRGMWAQEGRALDSVSPLPGCHTPTATLLARTPRCASGTRGSKLDPIVHVSLIRFLG